MTFLQNLKIWQSYTRLSYDAEVDLSKFAITLSRNDKIYPKTELKKIPVNRRFKTSWRGLWSRGIFRPFWSLELRLPPCGVVPYTPCQTIEKITEIVEMIRAEMSSIIPHFKPI